MSILPPSELLAQLKHYADGAAPDIDRDTAAHLRAAARAFAVRLEDGVDYTTRLMSIQPVEAMLVKIGMNLGLFAKLAKQPMTVQELQSNVPADPLLLNRVLRGLLSYHALARDSGDKIFVPPHSSILADVTFSGAFGTSQDFLRKTYDALPSLLADTGYQNPTDGKNTAVQRGLGFEGRDLYAFLHERPDYAAGFGGLMATWGEASSLVDRTYPMERLFAGFSAEKSDVFIVDVGGAYGQKTLALRRKFPSAPGRFVSQDLPFMAENAPKTTEIEIMSHDFFTPQPIKGAKVYHIRQTLHDFHDEQALACLRRQTEAMSPGYSRLLIHELIVPDHDIPNWTIVQDFHMMSLIGTRERTAAQWESLAHKAGLRVLKIWSPADGISESVLECEVAQ